MNNQKSLKWFSALLSLQVISALVYLSTLTTSAKGFSMPRLILLGLLGVAAAVFIFWTAILLIKPSLVWRVTGWLGRKLEYHNLEITLFAGLFTAAGVFLILDWSALPRTYEVTIALRRLYPIGILATLICLEIFLLAVVSRPSRDESGPFAALLVEIVQSPGRLSRLLCIFIAVLAVISVASQIVKYYFPAYFRFLDFLVAEWYLDYEKNIPTSFSALLMICIAVLFGWIAWRAHQNHRPFVLNWSFLVFLFLLLPVDEIFSLHEKLAEPVQDRIYAVGLLYWPWFLPILPVLAVLFFVYLRFFLRLPRRTFKLFMLSAAVYLGAAVVLEAVGAAYADEYGMGNFPYTLLATVEEVAEMGGLVLLLYTMLDYYRAVYLEPASQHPQPVLAAEPPPA